MTAACLTLLYQAARPIWPWCTPDASGFLVEAFPAAQLKRWTLPYQQYDGAKGIKNRLTILEGLERKLEVGAHRASLMASADAIDSVLCAFAAVAASEGALAVQAWESSDEGWIAVHH